MAGRHLHCGVGGVHRGGVEALPQYAGDIRGFGFGVALRLACCLADLVVRLGLEIGRRAPSPLGFHN